MTWTLIYPHPSLRLPYKLKMESACVERHIAICVSERKDVLSTTVDSDGCCISRIGVKGGFLADGWTWGTVRIRQWLSILVPGI